MKKCPKCNTEFEWGKEFCPSCGKNLKNPRVELHLKNASGQECKISCREKIKMSVLVTLAELRFGIPALDVKPVNKKDVVVTFALFLPIFIFPSIFPNGFGIFLCLAMVVVNFIYTMNFYYNAIKKKLAENYVPADEDTVTILQNAGFGNSAIQTGNIVSAADTNTTFTGNVTTSANTGTAFLGDTVSEKVTAFAENVKNASTNSGLNKYLTKKNIIIAAVVIVAIFIVAGLFSDNNSKTIDIVRNGSFYFDTTDATVGEQCEAIFDSVKWEAITADDGNRYVNMTGISSEGIECIIQFRVNEEKETFRIYACEVEGIPVPIEDLFY